MGPVHEQFDMLRARPRFEGARLTSVPNGTWIVAIPRFPLPAGWSKPETTVYFVVPVGYPVSKPDTFWTDPDLRLASGAPPQNAVPGGNYAEGLPHGLLWFSWHPSTWHPSRDNLLSYVGMIARRFQELR